MSCAELSEARGRTPTARAYLSQEDKATNPPACVGKLASNSKQRLVLIPWVGFFFYLIHQQRAAAG